MRNSKILFDQNSLKGYHLVSALQDQGFCNGQNFLFQHEDLFQGIYQCNLWIKEIF